MHGEFEDGLPPWKKLGLDRDFTAFRRRIQLVEKSRVCPPKLHRPPFNSGPFRNHPRIRPFSATSSGKGAEGNVLEHGRRPGGSSRPSAECRSMRRRRWRRRRRQRRRWRAHRRRLAPHYSGPAQVLRPPTHVADVCICTHQQRLRYTPELTRGWILDDVS